MLINCPLALTVTSWSKRFVPAVALSFQIPNALIMVVPFTIRLNAAGFRVIVFTPEVPEIVRLPWTVTFPVSVAVLAPVSNPQLKFRLPTV